MHENSVETLLRSAYLLLLNLESHSFQYSFRVNIIYNIVIMELQLNTILSVYNISPTNFSYHGIYLGYSSPLHAEQLVLLIYVMLLASRSNDILIVS